MPTPTHQTSTGAFANLLRPPKAVSVPRLPANQNTRVDGTQPLRFKVTNIKRYTWNDPMGELSAGEEVLDDFILIKATDYLLTTSRTSLDDYEMGVTHG